MLPDINLDNENYEDIIDTARNMIISLYPEWTDYNYHDPGITLIELFAWMKESQQFFLDQIGTEHRLKYLKLLGIRRKHKVPAVTLGKVNVEEDLSIMAGMKHYAGEICFESAERKYLIQHDVAKCFYGNETGIVEYIDRNHMEFGHRLKFHPFGQNPTKGEICYIGFENPLPIEEKLRICIGIFDEYPIRRNPIIDPLYAPLAVISYEYWADGEWRQVEFFEDGTHGFLADGFLDLKLCNKMQETEIHGQKGYFLRGVLEENHYDVPPGITNISLNVYQMIQQDTLAESREYEIETTGKYRMDTYLGVQGTSRVYIKINNGYYSWNDVQKEIDDEEGCAIIQIGHSPIPAEAQAVLIVNMEYSLFSKNIIGEGTGFPYQELELEDTEVLYDSFQILIQDAQNKKCYYRWEKVEDFGNSKPESMHYIFDSEHGRLQFGDCIRGMAPEGEILLIGYVRTLGSAGNIKAGKINRFGLPGTDEIPVTNIRDAEYGEDEETIEDSFLRARKSIKNSDCAITYEDYENYVRNTPGLMIESCRAIPSDEIKKLSRVMGESAVYIVAKPFSLGPAEKINVSYEKNIKSYLGQYRLLGTEIHMLQPEYIEVSVYIEMILNPQYLYAKSGIEQRVKDFFKQYETEFGAVVSYSGLYGALDRMDAVSGIRVLTLEAKGNGVIYSVGGDILFPPNGILLLANTRSSYSIGE